MEHPQMGEASLLLFEDLMVVWWLQGVKIGFGSQSLFLRIVLMFWIIHQVPLFVGREANRAANWMPKYARFYRCL